MVLQSLGFVLLLLTWTGVRSERYDDFTNQALDSIAFPIRYLVLNLNNYRITWPTNYKGVPCFLRRHGPCVVHPVFVCGAAVIRGQDIQKEYDNFINMYWEVEMPVFSECQGHNSFLLLVRKDGVTLNVKTVPSKGFYNNEYKYEAGPSDENDYRFTYEVVNWCIATYGAGCTKYCSPPSKFHRCRDIDSSLECVYGYGGYNCENAINHCSYNPCLNNAACKQIGSSYKCICSPGYTGLNCENRICQVSTCHSGTCVNYDAACHCSSRAEGGSCEKKLCPSDYCQNGGTCKSTGLFYYCECKPGFLGEICQHKCFPECINGQCILMDHRPVCQCRSSFIGEDCGKVATSLTCSDNNCRNGGACQKAASALGFLCACTDDWTGVYCETPKCDSSNCVKGLCALNNECKCIAGYTGERCDQTSCTGSNVCLNGGECVEASIYETACTCTNDNTGIFCEQKCSGGCGNYGKCVETSYGYNCECDSLHEGKNCEKLIDNSVCKYSNCQNGGICVERNRSYSCICSDYWSGTNCDVPICTSDQCQNGMCIDGVGCTCFSGYTGRKCESIICSVDYCKNNGFCVTNGYSLGCECDNAALTGDKCEYICPKRCVNGKCMLTFTKEAKCQCNLGFVGEDCNKRDTNALLAYLLGGLTGLTALILVTSLIMYVIAIKTYVPERDIRKERLDLEQVRKKVQQKQQLYAK